MIQVHMSDGSSYAFEMTTEELLNPRRPRKVFMAANSCIFRRLTPYVVGAPEDSDIVINIAQITRIRKLA